MKIIKKGDPKRIEGIITFECKNCGAIFEAGAKEYSFCPSPNNDSKYLLSICPCCKKRVWA